MDADFAAEVAALLDRGGPSAATIRRLVEEARDRPGREPRASLLGEVELRPPTPADESAWLAAVSASTALHAGKVNPPSDAKGYAGHLQRFEPDDQRGHLVWWREELAGVVNLQNIVRGNYLGTDVGYYAFEGFQGRGIMRTAVAMAVDIALRELELHRVEAGIQPTNTASIDLVRALGFRFEAYLPRLVRVDDEWRDHELWVTTSEEWPGAEAALGG